MNANSWQVLKRPLVLVLVYGASLALIGFSCGALAILGSEHVTASSIRTAVEADQATVRDFVTLYLAPEDVRAGVIRAERRVPLSAALRELARRHGFLELAILNPDGWTILGAQAGSQLVAPANNDLQGRPLGSSPTATIGPRTQPGGPRQVLTEHLPVLQEGQARLVFRIVRDADPIVADAATAWRDVVIVSGSSALVLTVLLHLIFRAANVRLARQDAHLAETRRRDPLTGLLNHGAVVADLTDLVESAQRSDESIGIALVDIDNFRLLNEVHGDPAGDVALMQVADALQRESWPWTALGRYGPDEFLAVAPASSARDLEAAMKRVRTQLEEVSLHFAGSARLPLSVSVGISFFPFHANAVTELISAATIALGEAKGSGGNETRVANAWTTDPASEQTTLGVLHGLVTAIDTKDRYTKSHSEDVACYALFLADRLGLDEELRSTLRVAGLLHDVGKIGISDEILRKPGKLTPHEYEIVKQHVALGDLIVRDLPDIDLVRAGVRHHHERWDGTGYLDGLAGEDIPLIARILAVGDAFSAMTTTRPYRKAIPVKEALARLVNAAGSQLDAKLVDAFVSGIENDPDAPTPGSDRSSSLLWTPVTRAA
ncbi:MAG: HD domain-containing phosphohydrolase [Chloroflexota bacterium]